MTIKNTISTDMNTINVSGTVTDVTFDNDEALYVTNVYFENRIPEGSNTFRLTFYDDEALWAYHLYKRGHRVEVSGRMYLDDSVPGMCCQITAIERLSHTDVHGFEVQRGLFQLPIDASDDFDRIFSAIEVAAINDESRREYLWHERLANELKYEADL